MAHGDCLSTTPHVGPQQDESWQAYMSTAPTSQFLILPSAHTVLATWSAGPKGGCAATNPPWPDSHTSLSLFVPPPFITHTSSYPYKCHLTPTWSRPELSSKAQKQSPLGAPAAHGGSLGSESQHLRFHRSMAVPTQVRWRRHREPCISLTGLPESGTQDSRGREGYPGEGS